MAFFSEMFELQSYVDQRRILEECSGIPRLHLPLSAKEENCVAQLWPLTKIFIISIRPKRLRRCLERMGALAQFATIVPACNGEQIDRRQWSDSLYPGGRLRRGELGCFESHCRIWRYMVEECVPQALILEDDAQLYPTAAVCQHLLWIKKDLAQIEWDIVCLGRSSEKRLNGPRLTPRLVISGDFYGLFAYSLKQAAAIVLLQHSVPFQEPVDILISSLGLSGKLRVLACEPEVLNVVNETSSDTISIV